MAKLISIITPNYNCVNFIRETIESVINQSFKNWEMIIQDDCSTDGSYEIACDYSKKDKRIKVYRNNKNSGAAVTRNNAIKQAEGNYIAFLDSDDLWLPDKLEKQIKFMTDNDCDFSFAKYEHIDESGKSLGVRAKVINRLTYTKLLMHCWPGCLTVMYNQDVTGKIYAGDVKKDNDHALFLRVIKKCHNAMGMNECLAKYRIRSGSISRDKKKIINCFVKVVHEFEGKSVPFAYFCIFTHMFIKSFFKYERIK